MLPFPQFLVGVCLCACVLTRMLGSPSDRLAVRLQVSKLSDLLGSRRQPTTCTPCAWRQEC